MPFRHDVEAWRNGEDTSLAHEPPLVSPAGRPVTAEEERARRGLPIG